MFFYRHIHILILTLALGLSYVMHKGLHFNVGRTPASTQQPDPNRWELNFGRIKRIWGVYELKSELIAGEKPKILANAIVKDDGLHLFREMNQGPTKTEIMHLKIPFKKTKIDQKVDELELVLDEQTKEALRSFTGGREVEDIACEKKWQTLSCSAKLAEFHGPLPHTSNTYSE